MAETMVKMIHTGSVIIDQVMTIPAIPDPGGDVVATSLESLVGGGYNTIVAALRDGLPVVYAGLLGTGDNAARAERALTAVGAEVALPPSNARDTGFCVALVDDMAERTFFTYVGAEGLIEYEDMASVSVQPGDLVYVTGYSMASETNAEGLIRWLPTLPAGTVTYVDPSPLVADMAAEHVMSLLENADIFSPNAREARILGDSDDLNTALSNLRSRLPFGAALVARDGARGAWVSVDGDDEGVWVPAFDVPVVDTNGAGDAFAGVLLASLSRGESLTSAVERANAAAAIAVSRRGPATSPTTIEIDEMIAKGSRVI